MLNVIQIIVSLMIAALFIGCSPVSISRIGPARPSRGKGCEVDVMPPGEEPPHPYRDLGVVHLTNCQEYTSGPCRKWLIDGVCTLGGNVAYLLDPTPPKNDFDAVNFRVTAGIYVEEPTSSAAQDGTCKEPPPDEENPKTEDCED